MSDDLATLQAKHRALLDEYEEHKAKADALKSDINQAALAVMAAEQAAGDEAAFADLRAREDKVSAQVAARTIAATMPDRERAAKFEALAEELAAG